MFLYKSYYILYTNYYYFIFLKIKNKQCIQINIKIFILHSSIKNKI